ncbi:MAG TPA: hypothetical protein VGZ48_05265 [Candidatus Acidoferrales bacterium]|jgi:hypothetical protein|nr:hypothetical protein [Candidatus Acidoferrales bacterium]
MQTSASTTEKVLFWREFWILFGAGLIAAAALAAISHLPTTAIAIFFFVKGGSNESTLLGIAAAETVIGLSLTVGLGLLAARSIGLGAQVLEKILQREPIGPYVRAALVPVLLVGISIGVWGEVPSLPVFHPNRELIQRRADQLLKSPAGANAEKFVERTAGRPLTNVYLGPFYLSEAISGELTRRLFLLSGIAWILIKISRAAPGTAPAAALWIAIILVPFLGAMPYLVLHYAYERLFSDAIGGIPIATDPFWLVATRLLVGSIPAGIGLGWLYIRRGLEAAITAATVGGVVAHLTAIFVLPHFY